MAERDLTQKKCNVEACHRHARTKGSPYCEAHYYRLRRNGKLDIEPPLVGNTYAHTAGYVIVNQPGHPLTIGRRRAHVYQHRQVFYDAHGAGPFNCHICNASIQFAEMHVDHLNDTPDDNRLANLAPACPTCNQWRGLGKMRATMRARHSKPIVWQGQSRTVSEWAAQIGITRASLISRLASGWSVEKAMTTPRGPTGPRPAAR